MAGNSLGMRRRWTVQRRKREKAVWTWSPVFVVVIKGTLQVVLFSEKMH